MSSQPSAEKKLIIDGSVYRIAEHPAAPGMPYGQEGRQATVYQLVAGEERHALKVFKPRYRLPSWVLLAERLEQWASLPGLQVCLRTVLTPQRHRDVLRQQPELVYAVLMPWIEGPTWMQVLIEKRALTPGECLKLARGLASVLASLEQHGLAHCDLSGPNVMLPCLGSTVPGEEARGEARGWSEPVAVVDVEQMYGPRLDRPELLPGGSPGYAHRSAPDGLWGATADRFAGAVLLGEMLGWCDERVRGAAWGENYFDPKEMQRDAERYGVLVAVLRERFGQGVASLLERAWQSDMLEDCATFGEWLVRLPEEVPESAVPDREGAHAGEAGGRAKTEAVRALMDLARRFEGQGKLPEALEGYRQARESAEAGSALEGELTLIIAELEGKQRVSTDADRLFTEALAAYEGKEWAKAQELLSEVVRLHPDYERDGQRAVGLLVDCERHLQRRPTIPSWVWAILLVVAVIVAAVAGQRRGGGEDGTQPTATATSINTPQMTATLTQAQATPLPLATPAAPSDLALVAQSQSSIHLTWTDNCEDEDAFSVYRDGSLVATVDADATSWTDTELECGTEYAYSVRAHNASGDSVASNTATVTTKDCPATACPAPGNLMAMALSESSIRLDWQDTCGNEDAFKIYRDGSPVGTVGAGIMSWTDEGLHCGTSYSYYVKAHNAAGNSAASNTASARTSDCPAQLCPAPGNLTAMAQSQSSIRLEWRDTCGDEDSFKIYRGGAPVATVVAGTTSWTDTGLVCGTGYSYHVKAHNAAGDSGSSNTASARTSDCPAQLCPEPGNLTTTAQSQSSIRLEWRDTCGDEDSFKIFRDGALVATVGAGTTSWTDTGLQCGTSYSYHVKAHNAAGDSGSSNNASARTGDCPPQLCPAPENLTATPRSQSSIQLGWRDTCGDEDSFKIYRDGSLAATVGAGTTSWTDEGLRCETQYSYYVKAHNAAGDSGVSNIASARTDNCLPQPCPAPGNLTATTLSDSSIRLDWQDTCGDEDSFKIYRDGSEVATVGAGTTSWTDEGLQCGTAYSYYVKAHNAAGDSGSSNNASARTNDCLPPVCPSAPHLYTIDNNDCDGGYLLHWEPPEGSIQDVTVYVLQEDDNSGFSSPSEVYRSIHRLTQISGRGPGTYYYRVKAINPECESGWSNVRSVKVCG